jgi:hypothetical protein
MGAKQTAEKVAVKYPAELGGYTPGDTWELYVGKNNHVEQFVYHRGMADGKALRVLVSDLAVKLTGSDTWINAQ